MSFAHVCRIKPPLLPDTPELKNDGNKKTLLKKPSPNAVKKSKHGMSLDEWVQFEERHWPDSRAREAARRIKIMQRGEGDDLNLSCLYLHTVPPITGCQKVTRFWLAGNCLGHLSDDLGDLPNLKILHIENSRLSEIPDFRKYPKLKMLSASGNPVRHIPPSIAKRGVAVFSLYTLADKRQRKDYFWVQQRRKVRRCLNRLSPMVANLMLPLPDALDRFPF